MPGPGTGAGQLLRGGEGRGRSHDPRTQSVISPPTRATHAHARHTRQLVVQLLQQLLAQRRLEADVLGPLDGQPVDGVVVDHLGDGVEGAAELAQDVLPRPRQLDAHVHEPVAAPGKYLMTNGKNI